MADAWDQFPDAQAKGDPWGQFPDAPQAGAEQPAMNPVEKMFREAAPSMYLPQSTYQNSSVMDEVKGLGEKGLNMLSGATTGLLSKALSGFAAVGAAPFVGMNKAADVARWAETHGMSGVYPPQTAAGQRPTIIGDAARSLPKFADFAGQKVSDFTNSPLVGALTTGAIDVAPMAFGLRGIGKGAAAEEAAALPKSPTDAMGLSSEDVTGAAQKLVTNTFKDFRKKVGDETPVAMDNTLEAAKAASAELLRVGAGKKGFGAALNAIVENNTGKAGTVKMLDDLASRLTKVISNPKAMGKSQARDVLEGVIQDMDTAGKPLGLNFADDLQTSRAFGELYKGNNLGKVVGQFGDTIEQYKAADPEAYAEIISDWTAKKVQTFVRPTPSGGQGFNTAMFAKWVGENEPYLERIIGPETLSVWKFFPKWEGAATAIKGIASSVADKATYGIFSKLFKKNVDTSFADTIANGLTDPSSPIFQILSKKQTEGGGFPAPSPEFLLRAVQGQVDGQDQRQ